MAHASGRRTCSYAGSGPKQDALDITMVDFDCPDAADRVLQSEEAKHTEYDSLSKLVQAKPSAFGVSFLGGAGPGVKLLGPICKRLAQEHGTTERPSVACQRGVAAQLLQAMAGINGPPWAPNRP